MEAITPRTDVTALMYFYCTAAKASDKWPSFEGALLETWRNCGLLKTVVVSNMRHSCLLKFAERYSNVELQLEDSLIPGSLKEMSIDCNSKLFTRFSTEYVLIVQNDGFPLRPGLDEFVGKYDYIGAPWEKHNTYYDLYPDRYRVGNGGFSLRSRRLCEAASTLYNKWFKHLPFWWYILGDDTFYCKTLRFWFPSYRKRFSWATIEEAARFSAESGCWKSMGVEKPFGFHGKLGWGNLKHTIGG